MSFVEWLGRMRTPRSERRLRPSIKILLLSPIDPQAVSAVLPQIAPGLSVARIGPPGPPRWLRTYPNIAAALRETSADYILFTAPGALLALDALNGLRAELHDHPSTDMVYADEDRIDETGQRQDPFHKPAWSVDLALEQNLAGAMLLIRRSLLPGCTPNLPPFPAAPLQDLALLAAPARIRHIPRILAYQCGRLPPAPTLNAVKQALARLATDPPQPCLVPSRFDPGRHRIRWSLPNPEPKVTIIIPTCDRPDLLARCLDGVLHHTEYGNLEILIADNGSSLPEIEDLRNRLGADRRVCILTIPGPFNFSAINNVAVAQATGSVLILLNDDIEIMHPSWLAEMVAHALRPDVGAVGARLLFPAGTIQHAGVVLGVGRFEQGPGIAGHFGYTSPATDPGPNDQFILTRELSAVTGACLAIRRQVFIESGGFDAVNLSVALNDVDLCLRLRALGYRIIWTPFAELRHVESATRGPDLSADNNPSSLRFIRECRFMRARWGATLDADPFYNRAFSRFDHSFQLSLPTGPSSPVL